MVVSSPADVIVLGGSGYVGRYVCTALAAAGQTVVAAGRRPPADPLPHRFVTLDLAQDAIPRIAAVLDAERPRAVVNTVGSIWGRTDEEMWQATVVPTVRLLDAFARMRARPRLVHLGSVLEYGPAPEGATVDGATTQPPDTAYGRGKRAATEAVLARAAAGEVDGMVLRIANVAGPGTPGVSLLGRVGEQLRTAAAQGVPAVVNLDPLRAHRDYVDVRDAAEAVVAAVRSDATGRVVDVGRGESVPVRKLVDLLVDASGVPTEVREHGTGTRDHSRRAGGELDRVRIDPRPAEELLGWRATRPLTESVRSLWEEVSAGRVPTPTGA